MRCLAPRGCLAPPHCSVNPALFTYLISNVSRKNEGCQTVPVLQKTAPEGRLRLCGDLIGPSVEADRGGDRQVEKVEEGDVAGVPGVEQVHAHERAEPIGEEQR